MVFFSSQQKEIQAAITETFANANRVTRPEKILIINFIAGVRGKYFSGFSGLSDSWCNTILRTDLVLRIF